MKAVVFTLGCKVNSCESAALMDALKLRGFEVSDELGFADLFIINTCAVTAEAEKKSRQSITRARKFNPECKIIVTGCASQNSPESFLKKNNVVTVTGAKRKSKLIEIIDEIVNSEKFTPLDKWTFGYETVNAPLKEEFDEQGGYIGTKDRHFIKIQDGCNNFCSYCIIPHLRGREVSRSAQSIIEEAKNTPAYEIVLTGINISSYDKGGEGLAGLLAELSGLKKRIRLGSLEANVIDINLLSVAKNLKDFAPHFHLSLQSGSDKVLKDMNRKYTAEAFLNKCALIRGYFPSAAITTDVIAGFPTESKEDFEQTLEVCKQAGFSDMHCFMFSKRSKTKAAQYKELDYETKSERLKILTNLAKELKTKYLEKNKDKILSVLFEDSEGGESVGYSPNYLRIYASGNLKGIITVKTNSDYKDGLFAEIIKE